MFNSPYLPLSSSSSHLLFAAFLICMAGSKVKEDGKRAGGGVVRMGGMVAGSVTGEKAVVTPEQPWQAGQAYASDSDGT